MSVLWKNCTTRGAVAGGFLGLISSVGLTIVSPSVWEATLGHAKGTALFPYQSPALFSMTLAFFTIWLVSVLDRSQQAAKSGPPSRRSKCARKPASAPKVPAVTEARQPLGRANGPPPHQAGPQRPAFFWL